LPLIWHFSGKGNTKKIEKNWERALRFIYGHLNSSYEGLLCNPKSPPLRVSRIRTLEIDTS